MRRCVIGEDASEVRGARTHGELRRLEAELAIVLRSILRAQRSAWRAHDVAPRNRAVDLRIRAGARVGAAARATATRTGGGGTPGTGAAFRAFKRTGGDEARARTTE